MSLIKLSKVNRAGWDSFSSHLTFKVGDGSRVRFWLDAWCGDQPLRDRFPELFRLARMPNASVADHLQISGSSHHWDIAFSRQVQDWELETVTALMELLYSYPIRRGSLDELCWRPSSRKVFTVRSYYSLFYNQLDPFSLGRVCGDQRCPLEWPSLHGLRPWGRFSQLTISVNEGWSL
jgi:hypothetical protein